MKSVQLQRVQKKKREKQQHTSISLKTLIFSIIAKIKKLLIIWKAKDTVCGQENMIVWIMHYYLSFQSHILYLLADEPLQRAECQKKLEKEKGFLTSLEPGQIHFCRVHGKTSCCFAESPKKCCKGSIKRKIFNLQKSLQRPKNS